MLIVPNHHVIVPNTKDVAFQINEIKSTAEDIIVVDLFGDSIICGKDPDASPPSGGVCHPLDTVTGRIPQPPSELLRLFLAQYRLIVNTRSVGGSDSASLLNGTDGANGPWPDQIEGNIVVINHGLNDARNGVAVATYKNNLIQLRTGLPADKIVVWQTPTKNLFYNMQPYAQAMREVAVQFNDIVADAYNLKNWEQLLPDGIHPRQLGYNFLIDAALAPAVNNAIVKYLADVRHPYYRKSYIQRASVSDQKVLKLDFEPTAHSWVEVYLRDNLTFQVVSQGYNDKSSLLPVGFYDYRSGKKLHGGSRSYNLVKIQRDTGKVTKLQSYDIHGDPAQALELAIELNRTNRDYIVVIYTYDEPKTNRLDPILLRALYRCGATPEIFYSSLFKSRSSYLLVGIPGCGPGGGIETYSGDLDNDEISYCEVVFELLPNGTPYALDLFPIVARTRNELGDYVVLTNTNYKLLTSVPMVNGTRVVNGKYATFFEPGMSRYSYNIHDGFIYFNEFIDGEVTVVCDTIEYTSSNSHVIDLTNINNYDYFVHRFHHARWARGNTSAVLGTAATGNLAPPQASGVSGVNNLKLTNTYVNLRVGDAHYVEPVVLTQPIKGYVRISQDRQKMVYTPFPNTYGLDSFSYTMLSQIGQYGLPASVYVEILPGPPDPVFSLTSDKTFVFEGQQANISLTVTNAPNISVVPYRISGVSSADLGNISLTGNFLLTNNTGTIFFKPARDRITEGPEKLTISLPGPYLPPVSVSVMIGDVSLSPGYALTSNVTSVAEGNAVLFTLTTVNLEDGYQIPYSILGISSVDIQTVTTGTFTVQSNTANVVVSVVEDLLTEGTELMSLELDNILPTVRASVSIIDTSRSATFLLTPDKSAIAEGESVTFTLTTTFVPNGTSVSWSLRNAGGFDIQDLLGLSSTQGTFTVVDGSAQTTFTARKDKTTEGSETLTMDLTNAVSGGQPVAVSAQVTILDTSQTPTYQLTANISQISEGDTVKITLNTTDVDDGTNVNYVVTGINAADVIAENQIIGNFTVVNSTAEKIFTLVKDRKTEGLETLKLTLPNVLSGNAVPSIDVAVLDTSQDPSFRITANLVSVDEGSTVRFRLFTTEVDDGLQVPYSIGGTGITTEDILSPLNGSFTVVNNTSSVEVTIKSDRKTEGPETLVFNLPSIANTGANTTSVSVNINDLSLDPSFKLSSNVSSVNEGGTVQFILETTEVDNNVTVGYTITGITANDIQQPLSGLFTINNNLAFAPVNVRADRTTEGPETMTMTLVGITAQLPNIVTKSVSITDTSLDPTYVLTSNVDTINEGGSVQFTLTTTEVDDNTKIGYELISTIDWGLPGLTGKFFNGSWRSSIASGNIGTLPLTSINQSANVVGITGLPSPAHRYGANVWPFINYSLVGDDYGFIAIGYFKAPVTGTYTFYTTSDDGSGVWVGPLAESIAGRLSTNATVNNNLGSGQGRTQRSGTINLLADNWYPIRIVHEEGGGSDSFTFAWQAPGAGISQNLTEYFRSPTTANGSLLGNFIDNADFDALGFNSLEDLDPVGQVISTGNFTIVSNTGTVTFKANLDKATEGTENIVMRLTGIPVTVSKAVEIVDTSTSPLYLLTVDKDQVAEGETIKFTLTTADIPDGTRVDYEFLPTTGFLPATDFDLLTQPPLSYSVYFNGTSDYLYSPTSMAIGNENFVIELWVFPTRLGVEQYLIDNSFWNNGNNGGYRLRITAQNTVSLTASQALYNSFPSIIETSGKLVLNKWSHIAIERYGNVWTCYINGSMDATGVYNASLDARSAPGTINFKIGGLVSDNRFVLPYRGYISNLRIIRSTGLLVYPQANYTEPKLPLSVLSGAATIVLTCADTTFKDRSLASVPIYTVGNPAIHNLNPFDADYTAGSVGSFFVFSNKAERVFTVFRDKITEGNETVTMKLIGIKRNVQVSTIILDTSKLPTYQIQANRTSVGEGETVRFTLTTTGIDDQSLINYRLVNANQTALSSLVDFSGLTSDVGIFNVVANVATTDITLRNDRLTEGTETFRLQLFSDSTVFATVAIIDTSTDPTYSLSFDKTTIYEGENITLTLTTTNVDNGSVFSGVLNGQASGPQGFTFPPISNNRASITLSTQVFGGFGGGGLRVRNLSATVTFPPTSTGVTSVISSAVNLYRTLTAGNRTDDLANPDFFALDLGSGVGQVSIRWFATTNRSGIPDAITVYWNGVAVINTGFVYDNFKTYTFMKTSSTPRFAYVVAEKARSNSGWTFVFDSRP